MPGGSVIVRISHCPSKEKIGMSPTLVVNAKQHLIWVLTIHYWKHVISICPNTFDWNKFCHDCHIVSCHGNQRFPPIIYFTISECLPACYNLNLHWFYITDMSFIRVKWGLLQFLPRFGDTLWQSCIFGHILWFFDIYAKLHLNISKSELKLRWPPVWSLKAHAPCHKPVHIWSVASSKMYDFGIGMMIAMVAMATRVMTTTNRLYSF